jgi:hypothetical protein
MRGGTCKKMTGTCTARNTTKIQRVKLGTNCLLGNRRKTSTSKADPRKVRHSLGTRQGKGLVITAVVAIIGPVAASKSATMKAMGSSHLRQTITMLTPKETTTVAKVRATMKAA